MAKHPRPGRSIPPLPPTPLARLADTERLTTRGVAAYARQSVCSVQTNRTRGRSPIPWHVEPGMTRPYAYAKDVKAWLARLKAEGKAEWKSQEDRRRSRDTAPQTPACFGD